MTTGVIYDTQKQALEMKRILEVNKVDFVYREVNEGHSWGNWRALLGDMLRYFFPM
jgi:enterochelin esterase family protein